VKLSIFLDRNTWYKDVFRLNSVHSDNPATKIKNKNKDLLMKQTHNKAHNYDHINFEINNV